MMDSDIVNRILANLSDMQARGASAFSDTSAGQEMHHAAAEIGDAIAAINRAAGRFGIDCEQWHKIRKKGWEAAQDGTPWYKNPYPPGSWQAYQWDKGQQSYHKVKRS